MATQDTGDDESGDGDQRSEGEWTPARYALAVRRLFAAVRRHQGAAIVASGGYLTRKAEYLPLGKPDPALADLTDEEICDLYCQYMIALRDPEMTTLPTDGSLAGCPDPQAYRLHHDAAYHEVRLQNDSAWYPWK